MIKNLNEFNLDILQEVSNIASGNAISALADFTDKHLDIYIPTATKVSFEEVACLLGDEDNIIIATLQEINKGFEGEILFTIDEDSFKSLLHGALEKYNIKLDHDKLDIYDLNGIGYSAIQEISNIITASYLSAISEMIGCEVNPSSPIIAIDMAGSILTDVCIPLSQSIDEVFIIKTELYLDSKTINSHLFLIPKRDGVDGLIKSIKEKYKLYE